MSSPVSNARSTRTGSIRERAYVHIQELIAQGTLAEGGNISELLLAKQLGSSRTPIREAMNQLAAEGLLSPARSGGMVVAQLTRDDIIELYELREALEVYAASKIAKQPLRAEDKQRLQAFVDEVAALEKELKQSRESALSPSRMERFLACDLGFHATLMSLTHNTRLQKIIQDTRLLMSIFSLRRSGHNAASLANIRTFHQRILDAVQQQDGPAAMGALSEHIQESLRERLHDFNEHRRQNSLRNAVPNIFSSGRRGTRSA